MNYLSVEQLSKSYSEKVLFSELTFGVEKGQKVALVAKNGTGKSSLLRVLSGEDTPDKGVVAFNKGIKVGFLEQEPDFEGSGTVSDAVFALDHPAMNAIKAYREATEKGDNDAMQQALQLMDDNEAWDMEVRVQEVLSKLKVGHLEQPVARLSGGQQKRIALAKLLLDDPDFFILDEPTNHLDLEIIEWLEKLLAASHKTIFMVTHDRYFLERVCNEIIELEGGDLYKYSGNYSYYLEKKEERRAQEAATVDKAKNLYKTELEWIRRQPQARGTKAKYRIDAFQDLKKTAHKKTDNSRLDIDLSGRRMGKKILEIKNLNKSFGQQAIANDFNYIFKRNEKVGIVGKNGVGKSTFLNMLTGGISPDSGEVIAGETVVFGYYEQKGIQLKEDKRVIEVIKDIAEYIPVASGGQISAGQLLEKFLFSPEMQYSYVSTLSGGERRRLYLLTILMTNPNFLILDEPTNDLDLLTLNVLEDYLLSFSGCVIVVSHDRYFMDKLVDHLFVFEGDGVIKDFNGRYVEYYEHLLAVEQEGKKQLSEDKGKVIKVKEAENNRKLTFKEKKELESLEQKIEELENRKESITSELSATADANQLKSLSEEFEVVQQELDKSSDRWLELSELL